jgi:D-alanyl-D-alanine dipeptidase
MAAMYQALTNVRLFIQSVRITLRVLAIAGNGTGRRVALAAIFAAGCLSSAAAQAPKLPAGFVYLRDIDPTIIQDMRYAGANNFVGRPLRGYQAAECVVKRKVGALLKSVQEELALQNLSLKMFDCYRPTRAVAHFVRWARDFADNAGKPEFYPDIDKRNLFKQGYIATHSGHSRGSTVDLTLAHADGAELDMGTPFDLFSPRSWPSDASVGSEARANRALLAAVMRRHGFVRYAKEWWHFTLANEPFPHTYFDFPVQ